MQDPSAYFLQQYRFENTRKQHLRFRFFALIASILILGSIGWFNKTLSFTGMVVFESIAIGSVFLLAVSAQRKERERKYERRKKVKKGEKKIRKGENEQKKKEKKTVKERRERMKKRRRRDKRNSTVSWARRWE